MTILLLRHALVFALLLWGAGTALAQEPPAVTASVTSPQRVEHGLRPISHLRVLTVGGDILAGTYGSTIADTLLLRQRAGLFTAAPAARIPVSAIDTVWVRRSAWLKGAVIGAAAGTVLYTTVAAGVEDDSAEAASLMLPTTLLEGVAFGVVIGGSWGAFIGSRFRRWQVHYARP